uniref:C2H2-type domain-containing protein n=1 Tax=Trichogramma kaykai TaxID=54128 RepID=A0ABD2WV02_9HYME
MMEDVDLIGDPRSQTLSFYPPPHILFCNRCNKVFNDRSKFTTHVKHLCGYEQKQCPHCPFKTFYRLNAHVCKRRSSSPWSPTSP